MGGLGDLLNEEVDDSPNTKDVSDRISDDECNSNKCERDIEVFTIGNGREVGYCLSHGITLFREYGHIHTLKKLEDE